MSGPLPEPVLQGRPADPRKQANGPAMPRGPHLLRQLCAGAVFDRVMLFRVKRAARKREHDAVRSLRVLPHQGDLSVFEGGRLVGAGCDRVLALRPTLQAREWPHQRGGLEGGLQWDWHRIPNVSWEGPSPPPSDRPRRPRACQTRRHGMERQLQTGNAPWDVQRRRRSGWHPAGRGRLEALLERQSPGLPPSSRAAAPQALAAGRLPPRSPPAPGAEANRQLPGHARGSRLPPTSENRTDRSYNAKYRWYTGVSPVISRALSVRRGLVMTGGAGWQAAPRLPRLVWPGTQLQSASSACLILVISSTC